MNESFYLKELPGAVAKPLLLCVWLGGEGVDGWGGWSQVGRRELSWKKSWPLQ